MRRREGASSSFERVGPLPASDKVSSQPSLQLSYPSRSSFDTPAPYIKLDFTMSQPPSQQYKAVSVGARDESAR